MVKKLRRSGLVERLLAARGRLTLPRGSSNGDGDLLTSIANRFDGCEKRGEGWVALCPVHDDNDASLAIDYGDDGKVLVLCRAGCPTKDVLAVVGLGFGDLLGEGRSRIDKTYDYSDAGGRLLYQVVRMVPKDFRMRRPDGAGGWDWKTKGVERVLYRLPEVLEAETVWVVEGEKDADRLTDLGLVATTAAGGAGRWEGRFSEVLRGKLVVVIPDNDEAGRKHAKGVTESLVGVARSVKVLELPGLKDKGDVSDWLDDGGTVERLIELAGGVVAVEGGIMPVPFLKFEKLYPRLRPPVVEGIARQGETVNIIAPSKVGKSWLALGLVLSIANGRRWLGRFKTAKGGRILLVDNELHPEVVAWRVRKVVNAMRVMVGNVDVISLRGKLAEMTYAELERKLGTYLKATDYRGVVIDAHYRMLPVGTDENDNAAIKDVFNLIDRLAGGGHAAWFLVHHSCKGDQSYKETVDVGAGAGSQSRAADAHLVLRPHKEKGCFVLDGEVRSFPPVEPFVVRWEFPVWRIELELNAKDKQTPERKKRTEESEAKMGAILRELEVENGQTANGLRAKVGMGIDVCKRLLEGMERDGKVISVDGIVSGNRTKIWGLPGVT